MNRVGLDVHRHLGVGLAAEPLELVDDRPAAAGPWVMSTSTLRCSSAAGGLDHVGDGEGIVHWGVVMPIDLEVEPPVEGVQVGDHGAGADPSHATPRRGRR